MQLICQTDDIAEGDARGFTTFTGDILIAQRDGSFYAYQNVCPHLQVNLEYLEDQFMDRDQQYIICSTHGALFEVESGHCIWGPCQGESLTPVAIAVHSDGGIYLAEQDA